jgi:hypothetical protein
VEAEFQPLRRQEQLPGAKVLLREDLMPVVPPRPVKLDDPQGKRT